ncbi:MULTISPECIES: hypothetical protein [unclassified Nocardia]|uniref:hypothetical protein n=1 Tax=unclassified Nocardia TaxID=2637762 RepID=UPI00278C8F0E|nr:MULTISPECIES: hypothetical protein [unclassified Nocardia]
MPDKTIDVLDQDADSPTSTPPETATTTATDSTGCDSSTDDMRTDRDRETPSDTDVATAKSTAPDSSRSSTADPATRADPIDQAAPAEKAARSGTPAPADSSARADKATPADSSAPAGEATPADNATPAGEVTSATSATPAGEATPGDNATPAGEVTPADDGAPSDKATPVASAASAGSAGAAESSDATGPTTPAHSRVAKTIRIRWRPAAGARRLAPAIALLLIIGLGAAAAYFGWQYREVRATEQASAAALRAAETYAVTLTSVDSADLDANFQAVLDGSTGEFRDAYTQSSSQLRQLLIDHRAAGKGVVLQSAVQSATRDEVVVLLFVDQTVTNTEMPDPRVDRSRIVMTMRLVDGQWKAARVDIP